MGATTAGTRTCPPPAPHPPTLPLVLIKSLPKLVVVFASAPPTVPCRVRVTFSKTIIFIIIDAHTSDSMAEVTGLQEEKETTAVSVLPFQSQLTGKNRIFFLLSIKLLSQPCVWSHTPRGETIKISIIYLLSVCAVTGGHLGYLSSVAVSLTE